jgi:ribosome-associated translation inhibitor RaiA
MNLNIEFHKIEKKDRFLEKVEKKISKVLKKFKPCKKQTANFRVTLDKSKNKSKRKIFKAAFEVATGEGRRIYINKKSDNLNKLLSNILKSISNNLKKESERNLNKKNENRLEAPYVF